MNTVITAAAGFFGFLYKFVVGDDWRVAVVMLLGLAVTGVLAKSHVIDAWWLVPILAVAMTGVSLRRRRLAPR